MTLNKRLNNFEKKVSDTSSNFLNKLAIYNANKEWLEKSSKVAISVLEALKDKGLTQKDLAEKMEVSAQQINKIVKGQQNLTFETVSKLESALGITLINIINYIPVPEIKVDSTQIKTTKKSLKEKFTSNAQTVENKASEFTQKNKFMRIVYKSELTYSEAV